MREADTEPLIQLRGVTRSFQMGESEFQALRGVDLDVDTGEFVAVIGPSGSGKSTLMYILGCLDQPSAGTYRLAGREASRLSDRQLSRVRNEEIGFVFQQYHLLAELNVVENIALGLVYGGSARQPRLDAARRQATDFGLGDHFFHTANQLSGGQMQRVAIARALAGRPRLILADEPTGNLDSKTGREIMQVLRRLHGHGHTIVLVTHDPQIAAQGERVISIVDGRITEDRKNSTFQPWDGTAAPAATDGAPDGGRPPRSAGPATGVGWADVLRMSVREGLLAKKARTFLTMLGIVFGIAAVISMNAITEGGKRKQLDQIRQIGLNNIQVRDAGLEGARLLRERRRNPEGVSRGDIAALLADLPELEALAAWKSIKAELRYGDEVLEDALVFGVQGDFQAVTNFHIGRGRFLRPMDQAEYHRVCVVGEAVARELNMGDEPLGQWLIIGDEPFRLVGIMGRKEFGESEVKDLQIRDRNLDVYLPHASLRAYFKKDPYDSQYDVVSMRMARDDGLLDASHYIHRMMVSLHREADDFEVSVPLEKIRQAQQTKEVFNVIIVVIAAISLLVGGIGIMNIMLATVTERTREIGVRRAVGASRTDVLNQFLAEALLISAVGGALGLALGMGAGKLTEAVFAFPVAFSVPVMVLAIIVSMLVGVGFGIYPAWLAARMDPVEALRTS